MPENSSPLVTIGVPVFNESGYIAQTLDNLLKQTYSPLEIIISDNGSTDGTADICAAYAQKYPHITYIRHPQNIGAVMNFQLPPTLRYRHLFLLGIRA